jgi:hypothetical protein
VFLTFLGLLLIISNISTKEFFATIKRTKEESQRKKDRKAYNSVMGSRIEYIERLIIKSNIRVFLPYSTWTHLFLCFIFLVLGSMWMRQYMNIMISIIFGIVFSSIPFLVLRIIADIISYRVKRNSVDFLIILKNFFISNCI